MNKRGPWSAEDGNGLPKTRVEYETIRKRFKLARKYAATPMPGQSIKTLLTLIEPEELNRLIETRLQALVADNTEEAARIHDELAAKGITLKDGKDPYTGKVVTTWEVSR